jgi:predicted ATP-grasp superfamily ATP-dependent carboligase
VPEDSNSLPAAIVVGLDCITGLQLARTLHYRGVQVIGIAGDARHFATRTRCVSDVFVVKPGTANLIDCLRGLSNSNPSVLLPATDLAVSCVAEHSEELSTLFRLANPDPTSIQRSLGKVPFTHHARQHGIPIPRTRFVENLESLRDAARELLAPFVLKPNVKTQLWDDLAGAKVIFAADGAALEQAYLRCQDWSDQFIVQEWVGGGDDAMYSYYAFNAADGRVVAECVGHKIRQWPRLTGSGTLSEICDEPEICKTGRLLLESLDHKGFATINMKRDPSDGKLFVIEANLGRPGMGMFVAEAAGIELSYLAYRSLAELPASAVPHIRFPRSRWVSLKRDVAAAFAGWRKGELSLAAYLRSMRGVRRRAVFDLRDPLPFLYDLLRSPMQMYQRQSNRNHH